MHYFGVNDYPAYVALDHEGRLRVAVSDDGDGFDPRATLGDGQG